MYPEYWLRFGFIGDSRNRPLSGTMGEGQRVKTLREVLVVCPWA